MLAAGEGTRLRSLWAGPKILLPVCGKPLLEWQIEHLSGFFKPREITFILSWKSKEVIDYIKKKKLQCSFSVVPFSDTGSELKNTTKQANPEDNFFVLNGDTLTNIHLKSFADYSRESKRGASIAVIQTDDVSQYGSIVIKDGLAAQFREKQGGKGQGFVNAGAYVLKKRTLEDFTGVFSLEKDVFPRLAKSKKLHAFLHEGYMFDCGTPERIAVAERHFRQL